MKNGKVQVDLKSWRKLSKQIAQLAQKRVKVGIVGDKAQQNHPDSNITYGELAAVHEYGSEQNHIPARSFIRQTAVNRTARKAIKAGVAAVAESAAKGESTLPAMSLLGEAVAKEMKSVITRNEAEGPELKQSTVDRKGSDVKLLDTGALRDAIGWEVE